MTTPPETEEVGTPGDHRESAGRGIRVMPLLGACLACCVPMLLILGVVSVGAALAGAVGLAIFVALILAATVIAPRIRRSSGR